MATRKASFQAIARWSKLILGSILIFVGDMIVTGGDKLAESSLLDAMPTWLVEFTTRYRMPRLSPC